MQVVNIIAARRETLPANILSYQSGGKGRGPLDDQMLTTCRLESRQKAKPPVPVYINYIFKSVSLT